MDDELQQLEAELKRLRPAAPSRELLARIGRDLAPAKIARRPSRAWWLLAAALPAAAAIALLVALNTRRAHSSNDSPPAKQDFAVNDIAPFRPVAAENVLYSARDEGLITLDDGTAARRERLRYVDTITWKNPRTNESVRWSIPREEVRVVPVIFQ